MRKIRRKNASESIEKMHKLRCESENMLYLSVETSVQEMKESGRKEMKKGAEKQIKKERK